MPVASSVAMKADTKCPVVCNGVGSSVVNALSSYLKAEVYREGKVHMQEYVRGKPKADVKSSRQNGKGKRHQNHIHARR